MSGIVQPYRSGGLGLGRYDEQGQELDWRTRMALARIEADRSVTRAAVDATEGEEAHAVERVIRNGEQLTQQALSGLERLSRRIDESSRHDPNLEFASREIERVFAMAAAQHIARYMTRER